MTELGTLSLPNETEGVAEPNGPTVDPRNQLNDLTGQEWIQATKSVWFQKGLGAAHPESKIERLHPAPFSYQDVARLIEFFTKTGEVVLDPFVGVGSTLKACVKTSRLGIGMELIGEWASLAAERLETECGTRDGQTILHGDARELLGGLAQESVDFVVTSPPYWGILNKKPDHKVRTERLGNGLATNYSDGASPSEAAGDLANISDYDEFLTELAAIFESTARVLRARRYLAIVVSDFRHAGAYIPFHSDLADRIRREGSLGLKGITILAQNHKNLYPYGYPYAYVPNVHHQYILIFQKAGLEK